MTTTWESDGFSRALAAGEGTAAEAVARKLFEGDVVIGEASIEGGQVNVRFEPWALSHGHWRVQVRVGPETATIYDETITVLVSVRSPGSAPIPYLLDDNGEQVTDDNDIPVEAA
ncbi:hypothetical protein [Cereibacter sphaeroides]|jgi:hypothetical protein|uniref:hypothetical protein n=1 Tax=Cereibacter sphaeroides TaxID=1063 RepID=UPI000066540F|nr:hypothetical protein Rsph17029_3338 [Cereibacter sphaeroides ATCC 17029]